MNSVSMIDHRTAALFLQPIKHKNDKYDHFFLSYIKKTTLKLQNSP